MVIYKILTLVSCLVIGYLFGSIPNSVIICRIFYNTDPRELGSHNPGGTNVGRSVSKGAGVLTIFLDLLKLLIPFLAAFALFTYCDPVRDFMLGEDQSYNVFGQGNTLSELAYYLVALGGMFGHAHSCFIHFKGGKIVSTYAGFALGSFWITLPVFGGMFFGTLKAKKYVSLASMVTATAICTYSWIVYIVFATCGPQVAGYLMFSQYGPHACIYLPILYTIGCAYLIYRHKENIKRLKNHTENKISWMK